MSEDIVPAVCYDMCNNAYIKAQTIGKKPELCLPDSGFELYYTACEQCITENANLSTTDFNNASSLKQFVD
ncbi:hypothetical protein B0T26DRAFT_756512 [Lasiosphaeria miniovina]|uniref:Uncharacterized protein n=1 Tax=Lasiosphaeria miniovina TaxID=1954250 RepID=A0AA40A0P8_9PEZI|nr:uncharacterized protein B0T26DRAFT_756512 [Lasiosphaeria miniovina]KAK0707125.1 hypothetical protein B0T26DRAFT_756512 [Lasiosphaeria miniovina]